MVGLVRIAIIDEDCSSESFPSELAGFLSSGGADVVPVNAASIALELSGVTPKVMAAGVPLAVDVAITRRVALFDAMLAPSLALLESSGVWVCNPPGPASVAFDKVRTAATLSAASIPYVETVAVSCAPAESIFPSIRSLAGPLVVKPATSGGGVGVVCVVDAAAAAEHIGRISGRLDFSDPEIVVASARHYVVQPLVGDGCDYRVFVVDGEVVTCTRRFSKPGEFRTNHQFASSLEPCSDPLVEDLAVQAASALGLQYAGVDVLVNAVGPQVLEVNGWPGLPRLARSGVPVAQALARFLLAGSPSG